MGFFWSGRHASVERIFKRSARYWVTSYVGNCLWGPPGYRRYQSDRRAEAREANEIAAERSAPYDLSDPVGTARRIGREVGAEGAARGWGKTRMAAVAAYRLDKVLGIKMTVQEVMEGWEGGAATADRDDSWSDRPPATARAGGLRGGAAAHWAAARRHDPKGGHW